MLTRASLLSLPSALAVLFVASIAFLSVPGTGLGQIFIQDTPGTRAPCVVYDARSFRGRALPLRANQSVGNLGRAWDDRLASVAIAPGCRLVTYEDPEFNGDRRTFSQDAPFMEGYWERRVSSLQCLCGAAGGTFDAGQPPAGTIAGGDGQGLPPSAGPSPDVCAVYRDPGLRGPWVEIGRDREAARLAPEVNGLVSSLSVPDGCELTVFDQEGGLGQSIGFSQGSYSQLGRTWDNVIRSAACACDGGRGSGSAEVEDREVDDPDGAEAGATPQAPPTVDASVMRCILYTEAGMRGRGVGLRDGTRGRLAGSAVDGSLSSVRVTRGCSLTLEDGDGAVRVFERSDDGVTGRWQRDARFAACACSQAAEEADGSQPQASAGGGGDGGQAAPEPMCVIYENKAFVGRRLQVPAGGGFSSLGQLDDRVSSVTVTEGCQLDAYEHADFNMATRGFKASFRRDAVRLDSSFDDRFSSVVCRCDAPAEPAASESSESGANRAGSQNAGGTPGAGVTSPDMMCALYEDRGRGGRSLEMAGNTGFRKLKSWAGLVSSVAVAEGCRLLLYGDEEYSGAGAPVDPGEFDLPPELDGAVRSAKCSCR
ncbi:MAG: hypothetical protein GC150_14165 [Rhizobiales bacterium]|nr:hypothetical protein [Hyphomicrobiales bacterium]